MKINEICREQRRRLEMSQAELCELSGTNRTSIVHFESGKSSIASKTLDKIFSTLGIELTLKP